MPPQVRRHSDPPRPGDARALSHVAPDGSARMVDVGEKPVSDRSAIAEGYVRVSRDLAAAIESNAVRKGSVLEVARWAGVLAAKRTDELIPLCHTLPLDAVDVSASLEPAGPGEACRRVRIVAHVRARARTGVEMEALVAVGIACLTVIDMGKAIDKGMTVEGLRVLEKHGGRSGSYLAPDAFPRGAAEPPR